MLNAVRTGCALAKARGMALDEAFIRELMSAVSEAFNNVVFHGYAGRRGDVEIEVTNDMCHDTVTVFLRDRGRFFDIEAVPPPPLETLPETGMGLHIMRSFVDELTFQPGDPNELRLSKRMRRRQTG